MRVLLTGSEGFIGKHVRRALSAAGHSVVPLDITLGVDITKPMGAVAGIDAVIHLAAMASPNECLSNPAMAYGVNVHGTSNVLDMAVRSGAKKVVFSSSAHVYDIPPRFMPTDETHPLRLNNVYTTTKILGEQLCQLYWENHGLLYTTLRLFNTYGVGQARGFFIPDMIAKAKRGAFTLGSANVTKDWVYIDDVAEAFVRAVETPFVGPINIGTGKQTDLGFIATRIAMANHVEVTTSLSDAPTAMRADISRARRVLGWEPKTTLEDGLARTILGL